MKAVVTAVLCYTARTALRVSSNSCDFPPIRKGFLAWIIFDPQVLRSVGRNIFTEAYEESVKTMGVPHGNDTTNTEPY